MSSRPQFNPYSVITNGDMSGNITSAVTVLQKLSLASYSITWSGSSPSGTVNVQVSNDYAQNADGTVKNSGTWNTLPLSITPTVSGNTGNGFIDIDQQGGFALRLTYAFISGTGTMNATINCKVA